MTKSLIIVGAILAISLVGLPFYCMTAHAVPKTLFSQVNKGMKFEEVEQLLGTPTNVAESPDGSKSWAYSFTFTWCMVTVDFSPKGEVLEVTHDH